MTTLGRAYSCVQVSHERGTCIQSKYLGSACAQEWVSVTPILARTVLNGWRQRTSYDRYYEGRKAYGTISSQVRILAYEQT